MLDHSRLCSIVDDHARVTCRVQIGVTCRVRISDQCLPTTVDLRLWFRFGLGYMYCRFRVRVRFRVT